jgi:hypothetical protein
MLALRFAVVYGFFTVNALRGIDGILSIVLGPRHLQFMGVLHRLD